jgi:pimeloyl-ACP methyl ester carboxylesterase
MSGQVAAGRVVGSHTFTSHAGPPIRPRWRPRSGYADFSKATPAASGKRGSLGRRFARPLHAYPLLGPGGATELLSVTLPTLIVQGGSDPFGTPDQFPRLPPGMRLVQIPSANHMFASARGRSGDAFDAITTAVAAWIDVLIDADLRRSGRRSPR